MEKKKTFTKKLAEFVDSKVNETGVENDNGAAVVVVNDGEYTTGLAVGKGLDLAQAVTNGLEKNGALREIFAIAVCAYIAKHKGEQVADKILTMIERARNFEPDEEGEES